MESTNNYLFDKPIAEINELLKSKLSWITNAFGRAQRLVRKQDNRDSYYPGVYTQKGEYINVMPGEYNGNFSFAFFSGNQKVESFKPWTKIAGAVSFIFFIDLSKVFPDNDNRNTEQIKDEIIRVLKSNHSNLELVEISESPDVVYREFSFKEVDTQYQMYPFYCLRLNTTIKITMCND